MSTPFIPGREADLITWLNNFHTKINLAPTSVGLTPSQCTTNGTLTSAFVAAHGVANDPTTRSPANVALKNVAKANVIANVRMLAGIVQSFPGTTNPMRVDLGLPERDLTPTPVPPPATAPGLIVKSVNGRVVRVRMFDPAHPDRRARPDGVIGASVFSFVGDEPPALASAFKFEGNTGVMTFDVEFPVTVAPGSTVWFTAVFFNPSKQSSPASPPVSTQLQFGGSLPMAA